MAPSATIMIFSLFLPARFYEWRETRYRKTDKTKHRGVPKLETIWWKQFSLFFVVVCLFLHNDQMKIYFILMWSCFHSGLCVWSPLAAWSSTHILHQTRRNCFPMSVSGSLCHYDNVQPRTSGSSLGSWAHFGITRTQNIRETQRHWRSLSDTLPWNTAAWRWIKTGWQFLCSTVKSQLYSQYRNEPVYRA